MLLDRHRVARLVELSALAGRLDPGERMLREDEVTMLVRAAYDDASATARQAFLQRLKTSRAAWPWSAVMAGPDTPPPLLTLLLGQVVAADDDPGDRLPPRGQLGSAGFEALHQALQRWDAATIRRHIGPQGWVVPSGNPTAREQSFAGSSVRPRAAMNLGSTGGVRPGGGVRGGQAGGAGAGGNPPGGGTGTGPSAGTGTEVPADGGQTGTGGAPPGGAPTGTTQELAVPTWSRGAAIAAAAVGVGAAGLVALAVSRARQERELQTLRDRLQEYEP